MFYLEVHSYIIPSFLADIDTLLLGEKYTLDQYAVQDIKSVLRDQQEGIQVNKTHVLMFYCIFFCFSRHLFSV